MYQRKNEDPPSCPNNEGVTCSNFGSCDGCGWNPKVARERLLQICFDKGITIPAEFLDGM